MPVLQLPCHSFSGQAKKYSASIPFGLRSNKLCLTGNSTCLVSESSSPTIGSSESQLHLTPGLLCQAPRARYSSPSSMLTVSLSFSVQQPNASADSLSCSLFILFSIRLCSLPLFLHPCVLLCPLCLIFVILLCVGL